MSLTKEQQLIVDTVKKPSTDLLKINAVAGSGKTHSLIAIAKALKPDSALYIAFNKSIATEAATKFPINVECKTLHALAYKYVYKEFNTDVHGNLSYRDIKYKYYLRYEEKIEIVEAIEAFFTSDSIDMSFFHERLPSKLILPAKSTVDSMMQGTLPVTFNFLLKYFHLRLAHNDLDIEPYDLLMLDEAGDTTEVSLEIFKLLPAKKKVMVGDLQQNIYTFMNTINGFEKLKDQGTLLHLTKSFRVEKSIAKEVQKFCRKTLDTNMKFEGTKIEDKSISNIAYISRTNSELISRMFHLLEHNQDFCLIRNPKEIFSLPLALVTAISGKEIYDKRYKHLNEDYAKFNSSEELQKHYKPFGGFLGYLLEEYDKDIPLVTAISLLRKHSFSAIFDLYNLVKNYHQRKKKIILTTAHSSKGLDFDAVYIEEDLNNSVIKAMATDKPNEDTITTFRLAYTAITRCKVALFNCRFVNVSEPPLDILFTKG